MEDLTKNIWALRGLATDKKYQGNGYGSVLLKLLETWCKNRNGAIIKLHSAPQAENFYRKLGYNSIVWDDESINEKVIDLGKRL